jgi:hypothetical protein
LWNNKAGSSWALTAVYSTDGLTIESFDLGDDSPYGSEENAPLSYDSEGSIIGI